MADETQHPSDVPAPAAPEKILARGVFENCIHDQTEAPWEEEVRMILAHDAAIRIALAAAERENDDLRRQRSGFDCRFTPGNVADISGSHCPPEKPCDRCEAEKVERQLDEAVGALRPFAKAAVCLDADEGDTVLVLRWKWNGTEVDITNGDLRRAAAVLARIAGESPR